jgi:phosphatidylserine/phosphatidylglycerophosphate/cardiolipin synthase-like enzyme
LKRLKYLFAAVLALSLAVGGIVYAQSVSSTKLQDTQVDWAFTKAGQHPEKLLIGVIKSTKTSLDIAAYSLTYPDIVQAIKDAKKRGVAVRIISDKIQSAGKAQSEALKILGSAGIPIKINTHSGLMHLKVTVADKKIATIGSFNYSQAASTTNDEVIMVVHDAKVAKSFGDEFEAMWNDNKGFHTITPKIAQPAGNNPSPAPTGNEVYANCAAVKAAGKAPLHKGDPGYSSKLDRDGDGIACEK